MSVESDELTRKALEISAGRQWWVMTWRGLLWFALPFVTLWGLGVDPVAAVRVAAGTSACLIAAGAAVSASLAILGHLAVQAGKAVDK